jgi:hypothetical protein
MTDPRHLGRDWHASTTDAVIRYAGFKSGSLNKE